MTPPPLSKSIVRGTTKMSLHDRFTALRQLSTPRASQPSQSRGIVPTTNKASVPLYKPRPQQQTALQRTVAMEAALKIKKKSLKHRLGHHQQIRPTYLRGNNSFRSRRPSRPFEKYPRWANHSVNKKNVTSTFRGRARGRGNYRRLSRVPLNNNYNRKTHNNKRPNRRNKDGHPPSKDELDAQLDNYMSSTKSLLDDDPME